jgi:hypothetical protein
MFTKTNLYIYEVRFIKFLVVWISQNLAIPFWIVGHVHLSIHNFHDAIELISSVGMNVIVAIGFLIDYNNDRATDTEQKDKAT